MLIPDAGFYWVKPWGEFGIAQAASTTLEPEVVELVHYFKIGDRHWGLPTDVGVRALLNMDLGHKGGDVGLIKITQKQWPNRCFEKNSGDIYILCFDFINKNILLFCESFPVQIFP